MALVPPQTIWIWHPEWVDTHPESAGAFVHFRKSFKLNQQPIDPIKIQISADTKYKLFVNSQLIGFGPVKGDQHLWFYDEYDIQPYLRPGLNHITARVLRFYHTTRYATSFPRLQSPGFMIRHPHKADETDVHTDETWETALDMSTLLPIDINEDDFLHVYEQVDHSGQPSLEWEKAEILDFPSSHGLTPPWKLSPRLIPPFRLGVGSIKGLHNIQSDVPTMELEHNLLGSKDKTKTPAGIKFNAGTKHHIELEADQHLTAFIAFRFTRPSCPGAFLRVTYSECYEDLPVSIPYLRSKGDRRDASKHLLGPYDTYRFCGPDTHRSWEQLRYNETVSNEIFVPFHFRTFRFISLDIEVATDADLILQAIEITTINYPLDVRASFSTATSESCRTQQDDYQTIWATSLRTLTNCLHDSFEDCPFYEQLQYAMDTRSSILFTYSISNDDRLARQAIIQLHNSYIPSIGLTASRAPAHQTQIIPHFSLFWILMLSDHLRYYGDLEFIRKFCHTCDGILETFARDIDPEIGLIRYDKQSPHWFFVDWADAWRPMGIPPAGPRTGFLSFTNMLYAYTLQAAASICRSLGRAGLAEEYISRSRSIVGSIRTHCFDGELFTDGLASQCDQAQDYSQQTQLWAVLSGAAEKNVATSILRKCLDPKTTKTSRESPQSVLFSPASTAMSFYTLRALSTASSTLYNEHFHGFWTPWRDQLALNLTTWEEDSVSQRSDCHAWGCAALYEFTAEVAGLRPEGPGWAKIVFEPRIGLFERVSGTVPFGGTRHSGTASIEWSSLQSRRCVVSLELTLDKPGEGAVLPPVELRFPDGTFDCVEYTGVITREIEI